MSEPCGCKIVYSYASYIQKCRLCRAAPAMREALVALREHAHDFAKLPGYRVTDQDREQGPLIMGQFEEACGAADAALALVAGGEPQAETPEVERG